MAKKKKKKLNIHIVDSIKGGSGKSTFSAKLCANLSLQYGVKPCIIDLDLLGTSWQYVFGNCIEGIEDGEYKLIYLNDLVRDYEYYIRTMFIQKINVNLALSTATATNQPQIHTIFSNPTQKAKNEYKISDSKYMPDVSYDIFYRVVFELINYLGDEEYTDIILDMPPNSDPYSDKILHACLKPEFKHNTSLYMVSSTNIAHIMSTFEWYSDYISNTDSQHSVIPKKVLADFNKKEKDDWFKSEKTKFFFVFNEMRVPEGRTSGSLDAHVLIDMFEGKNIVDKLAYCFVKFDETYSRSVDEKAISNNKEPIGLKPFDNTKFFVSNEISEDSYYVWEPDKPKS